MFMEWFADVGKLVGNGNVCVLEASVRAVTIRFLCACTRFALCVDSAAAIRWAGTSGVIKCAVSKEQCCAFCVVRILASKLEMNGVLCAYDRIFDLRHWQRVWYSINRDHRVSLISLDVQSSQKSGCCPDELPNCRRLY